MNTGGEASFARGHVERAALHVTFDELLIHLRLVVQRDVHHVEAILADVAVIAAHGHAAGASRDTAREAEAGSPGVALREEPLAEVRRREERPNARQRRVALEVDIEL